MSCLLINKIIETNNQLQINELERQRITNAHNQLSEQLNAGLTENNDLRFTNLQSEEKIKSLNEELLQIKKQKENSERQHITNLHN